MNNKMLIVDGADWVSSQRFDELDFRVPVDRVLVDALKLANLKSNGGIPNIDLMTVNEFIKSGLIGRSHVIDVSGDDPNGYFFSWFSRTPTVSNGGDFSKQYLGDYSFRCVRDWARIEFAEAKSVAAPILSAVSMVVAERRVVYRRLVIPMARDGRKVTDLLVTFTENLV